MVLKVKKFLVTPQLKQDEFILSFLTRLKKSNAYPNLNSVIQTIFGEKISKINITKGNFNKIILSKTISHSIEKINNSCINTEDYYCVSNVFLCPICIENTKYISVSWYKKDSLCSIHKLPFISKCPHCQKKISWDADNFSKCMFCKEIYSKNIRKYIIPITNKQEQQNLYFVYKQILNYKVYSPDSIAFSLEYLSNGLKESLSFINNSNNEIDLFIRKIFFRKNYPNLDIGPIVDEIIIFVGKIIHLNSNLDCNKKDLLSIIEKYINTKTILKIKYDIDNHLFDYYKNYKSRGLLHEHNFSLSIQNISNILNLNIFCVEQLFKSSTNDKEYIPIQDFFEFCIYLSKKSTNIDLDQNYYYLSDLESTLQIRLIRSHLSLLYNFNIKSVLKDVKICKHEISKMY
ncbi:TPA: hypothetical protein JI173_00100 [Acinetobacter baumannii]|nr:hypothetical protein [Acinetobacter baumannii]